jgi:hypothetical protein
MKTLLCFVASALLCSSVFADRLACSSSGAIRGKYTELTASGIAKFQDEYGYTILFSFNNCYVVLGES